MNVVIAIDPGATSGWAGLTVDPNPDLILFDSMEMPKSGTPKDTLARTPSFIAASIVETLSSFGHSIVVVAIEDQYLSKNPDSMKKLCRNAGRWEEAWRRLGYPVEWVVAQTWQSAELGTSRIDSAEVKRRCAMKVLGVWRKKVGKHAADAALIGRYVAIRRAYRDMRGER